MWRRVRLLLMGAAVGVLCFGAPVHADEPKNKGLFISPLRSYIHVAANSAQHGTFTVANNTASPMSIDLSVEQFSVADYTYDYQFERAKEDWVKISQTQLELAPDKSQNLNYTVATPPKATPGGHYFTIFATAHLQGNPSQIRAATVLYVTVEGALVKTSIVNHTSVPSFSFGRDIDFSLDVKNTGNTHFFTYTSGTLSGFSANSDAPESTNLLLPGTSRIIGSTIRAPLLPGIYKATYGYRIDDGQRVQRSSYIVYIPPWSLLVPIGIAWFVYALHHYRKRRRT